MANETIDGKTRSRLILAARLAAVLLLIALLMRCNEQRSAIANALPDPKAASTPPASGVARGSGDMAGRVPAACRSSGREEAARQEIMSSRPRHWQAIRASLARHADTPAMEDPMTPEAGDGDGEGASGDAPLSLADGGDGGFFHMGPGSAVRKAAAVGSAFGGSGGGSGGGEQWRRQQLRQGRAMRHARQRPGPAHADRACPNHRPGCSSWRASSRSAHCCA